MELLIGTHTSVAGGIQNSYGRIANVGGNAMQIFAKSPRGRNFVNENLTPQVVAECQKEQDKTNIKWSVIHSIYLINLGKPFSETENARHSIVDDFLVAEKLGIQAVNIHLGKYGDYTKDEAIGYMVDNTLNVLERIKDIDVKFVFENTAGQGSEIGWQFDELGDFYNRLYQKMPDLVEDKVRFCIDTAHAWGAGYDIRNFDSVLKAFDEAIGLDKLMFFHLNDAKVPKGSRLDRHAPLGRGFIGIDGIYQVVKWAYENDRPIILETPIPEIWDQEIDIVKKMISGEYDEKWRKEFNSKYWKTEYLKKFEELAKGGDSLFG